MFASLFARFGPRRPKTAPTPKPRRKALARPKPESLEGRALLAALPVAPSGVNAAAAYVTRVYNDLLARDPEPTALQYWGQQLTTNRVDPSRFVNAVIGSAEYRNVVVSSMYVGYLGRLAAPGEVAYYANQMAQGVSAEAVQTSFLASPEYYALAGGTNVGWASAVALDTLGRSLDPVTANLSLSALAAGSSRSQVAAAFQTSTEGVTAAVHGAYGAYLGRSAEPAGLAYFTGQLQRGVSSRVLLAQILTSPEYARNALGYS